MRIVGTIDTIPIRRMIDQLASNVTDLKPLNQRIVSHMVDAIHENFEKEGRPRWPGLSEVTKAGRRKIGKSTAKMLQLSSAGLANSIQGQATGEAAIAGTNKEHAGTHQYGARKGQYGKTRRGGPIPWGNIPARPFLKLTPEDYEIIIEETIDYLLHDTRI